MLSPAGLRYPPFHAKPSLFKFHSPQVLNLFSAATFAETYTLKGYLKRDYCNLCPLSKFLMSAYIILGSVLGDVEQTRSLSHGVYNLQTIKMLTKK